MNEFEAQEIIRQVMVRIADQLEVLSTFPESQAATGTQALSAASKTLIELANEYYKPQGSVH